MLRNNWDVGGKPWEKAFLDSSHLLCPLAEVGLAECLGQELGAPPLQELRGEGAASGAPGPDPLRAAAG